MATKEVLEFKGKVIEQLPNATFKVRLENGAMIIAYTSGNMRKHHIRVIAGDEVTVEMTPYDLSKGRVTRRTKTPAPGETAATPQS